MDPEDVELVRNWELPVLKEGDSALQATEDEREEVEEALYRKTVAELKVLLRELGVQVSGKKADLVIRCADALIDGAEEDFGDEVGMFRRRWRLRLREACMAAAGAWGEA